MLDAERNRMLMEVGAGKPMGEVLRRYWHPIAAESEFSDKNTKSVRLLGENLVLYKDLGGTYGLLDRHCPHRRADLSYGYVEQDGLRCNYHGWLFGADGKCRAQPYEDVEDPSGRLRKTIQIKNYRVAQNGGLIWAYLGPDPAPEPPCYEHFHWQNGFRQIVFSEIPCNWFQCQENSIDPVHFEWMHSNWDIRLKGKTGPYSPAHVKVDFDEFEHGFIYRRIRVDTDETHPMWQLGRVCLWPYALATRSHIEWRVPIDDETTLSVGWFFDRVPREKEPYIQNAVPSWHAPIKDPKTGRWITSHVMNQDFVAWVGQGTFADRSRELLGKSDRGIAMIRQRYFRDMEAVKRGEDPKAVYRDPKQAARIQFPIDGLEVFRDGETHSDHPRRRKFTFLAGQPAEVTRAYDDAMGFTQDK